MHSNYSIEISNIQGYSTSSDNLITHIKNKILKVNISVNPQPLQEDLLNVKSCLVIDNEEENYPEISSFKKTSDIFESSCNKKNSAEYAFSIKIKTLSRDYQNLFFRVKFCLLYQDQLINFCITDPIQIISKNPISKKRRNSDSKKDEILINKKERRCSSSVLPSNSPLQCGQIEDIKSGLNSIQQQILTISSSLSATSFAAQYIQSSNDPEKSDQLVSSFVSCFKSNPSIFNKFLNELSRKKALIEHTPTLSNFNIDMPSIEEKSFNLNNFSPSLFQDVSYLETSFHFLDDI